MAVGKEVRLDRGGMAMEVMGMEGDGVEVVGDMVGEEEDTEEVAGDMDEGEVEAGGEKSLLSEIVMDLWVFFCWR